MQLQVLFGRPRWTSTEPAAGPTHWRTDPLPKSGGVHRGWIHRFGVQVMTTRDSRQFWAIADLMRRNGDWKPVSAVYAWSRTLGLRGHSWSVTHGIFSSIESDGRASRERCQVEATVTLWLPVELRGKSANEFIRRTRSDSTINDIVGPDYDGDWKHLSARGFATFTRLLRTPNQLARELRRMERAPSRAPSERHSREPSSLPSFADGRVSRQARSTNTTGAVPRFWAVSDFIRSASTGVQPVQASYASHIDISKVGHPWSVELTFGVDLDPERNTFSPPFTSCIWIQPTIALDREDAMRLKRTGVYRALLLEFAGKGFHGRWSGRAGVAVLSGRFEKLTWELGEARADLKRLADLRVSLLRHRLGIS